MKNLPPHKSKTDITQIHTLADRLFQERKKSLPKYTERELIEIFSPSIEILQINLKKYSEIYHRKRNHIKKVLQMIYLTITDEFAQWFGETVIKVFLIPDLEKYTRHIARLKRLLNMRHNPHNTLKITSQEALEEARRYPIYDIAKQRLVLQPCGNKSSSLCPFHEEKHASFYIYHETNTFHCFGCQESGDVIKLTMHLYGASFTEAVQMLQ